MVIILFNHRLTAQFLYYITNRILTGSLRGHSITKFST